MPVIKISWVASNTTVVTQLRTGEADAWFRADAGLYQQLRTIPGYVVKGTPDNVFGHIDFNLRDPLLQDVRLRRALMFGIDRRRIAHEATHDLYVVSNSDQPAFSWARDSDLPPVTFDPARSRALLDEAGWRLGPDGIRVKNGQRLSLQLSYLGGQAMPTAIGSIMQQELHAVGIDLTQKTYPLALLFAPFAAGGIVETGKYQLAYFGWNNGVDPNESNLYFSNQMPPNGQNSLFWSDPKVDAAEADALSTFDIKRIARDYAVVQAGIVDKVPTIVMFFEQRIEVYNEHLRNFYPSPAQSSAWNSWEWSMQ